MESFFSTPMGRDNSPGAEEAKEETLAPGTQGIQGRGTARIPQALEEDVRQDAERYETNNDDPNDNPDDHALLDPDERM